MEVNVDSQYEVPPMKYEAVSLIKRWEQDVLSGANIPPHEIAHIVSVLSNVPEVLESETTPRQIPTVEWTGANC
jgi:hypothetical protein